jgi:hypothetical protein
MRKQERPTHEILSFARYLNKVFDLRSTVADLTDCRSAREIAPAAVLRAVFHGFVFRLPSFQQLQNYSSPRPSHPSAQQGFRHRPRAGPQRGRPGWHRSALQLQPLL